MKTLRPLKAIRKDCLECSGSSAKAVAYCTCDGALSTRCNVWPYRFGFRPQNVQPREFVTPGALPGHTVQLESLPTVAITCKSGQTMSPEQRRQNIERLRRAREAACTAETAAAG